MSERKKIIVTGTGVVAGSIVRALVPAGYDVETHGLDKQGLTVFETLGIGELSEENILAILRGEKKINPFTMLPAYNVPHHTEDLSSAAKFQNVDTVILTAGNPNNDQTSASARTNYQIDMNSLEAAIKCGAKNIILTSSLWRTMGEFGSTEIGATRLIKPETQGVFHKAVPYSREKENSVRSLEDVAQKNPDRVFSYIDLGWNPRETMGQPISNVSPQLLQWWFAECELQQLYLLLANITDNPAYKQQIADGKNFFAFNGFSQNDPPSKLNHPPFAYDLSNSRNLGVKHEFNVYDILESQKSDWRRIPIPSK